MAAPPLLLGGPLRRERLFRLAYQSDTPRRFATPLLIRNDSA